MLCTNFALNTFHTNLIIQTLFYKNFYAHAYLHNHSWCTCSKYGTIPPYHILGNRNADIDISSRPTKMEYERKIVRKSIKEEYTRTDTKLATELHVLTIWLACHTLVSKTLAMSWRRKWERLSKTRIIWLRPDRFGTCEMLLSVWMFRWISSYNYRKGFSIPMQLHDKIHLKFKTLRSISQVPKQSSFNQIVDQQPLRWLTETALGQQFAAGVSPVKTRLMLFSSNYYFCLTWARALPQHWCTPWRARWRWSCWKYDSASRWTAWDKGMVFWSWLCCAVNTGGCTHLPVLRRNTDAPVFVKLG